MFYRSAFRTLLVSFLLLSSMTGRCSAESRAEIPLGILIPLSGPYASLGDDCRRGVGVTERVLADHLQDSPEKVRFEYADSVAEPRAAMSEFEKLTNRSRVVAVLTNRSPVGMALNPLSRRTGIPLVGAVGHRDFPTENPYAYQFWPSTVVEGEAYAKRMLRTRETRVALITTEDEWTEMLSEGFRNHFLKSGGELVFAESIAPEVQDFNSLATRMRSSSPDALFVNLGIGQLALMSKRIREQGMKQPLYANFWFSKREVIDAAGPAVANGVMFIETSLARPKFRSMLKEIYGDDRATSMTFSCYAGSTFLLEAIKVGTRPVTSASVHQALLHISALDLLDSRLEIHNRRAQFPLALKVIEDSSIREVEAVAE